MSRSGYYEDCSDDQWGLIRWRGAVASAFRGKRGQAFLREMLAALDAMPTKRLVKNELEHDGEVCALGAVGRHRGIDMAAIDPEEREEVAAAFGIAEAMAAEIMYENDEGVFRSETPEQRFERIRAWVVGRIATTPESPHGVEELEQALAGIIDGAPTGVIARIRKASN